MIPTIFLGLSLIAANPAVTPATPDDMENRPIETIIRLAVQYCYLKNNQQLGPAFDTCNAEQQAATIEFIDMTKTILDAGGDPIPALTTCLNVHTIQGIALDTVAVRDCFYGEIGALKGKF